MVWKRAEDLVEYYADDFKDFTRDTFNYTNTASDQCWYNSEGG